MPNPDAALISAAFQSLEEEPETETGARLARPPEGPPPTAPPPQHEFPNTDLGLAERLRLRHGEDIRYCYPWKTWLIWDGNRWAVDGTGGIFRLCAETVRSIYREVSEIDSKPGRVAKAKFAFKSESRKAISAMEELARSLPGMSVSVEDLDVDPYTLNCQNGYVNLKTGELHAPDRRLMVTRLVPHNYNPEACAERWDQFCYQIMLERDNLLAFLQRSVGYSITGSTSEKVLFLCHGGGNNGKTTFLETLRSVLGAYGGQILVESLMVQKYSNSGAASPDIADLRGLRFVTSSESEEGTRLAEAKIKYLTGMNRIKARYLHSNGWEFRPTCKLWMDLNHLPNIRGTDKAIWNRIRKIPFNLELEPEDADAADGLKIDRGMMGKLLAEAEGILRWAIDGAVAWHRDGLGCPEEVASATSEYRHQMDVLGRFLGEATETGLPTNGIPARQLYRVYCNWAEHSGEFTLSERVFAERLMDRGIEKKRSSTGAQYIGLRLSDEIKDFS